MLKTTLCVLSAIGLAAASAGFFEYFQAGAPAKREFTLCTYSNVSYEKCLHTVHVAENRSIPLRLACVQQADRNGCLQDVLRSASDLVVLQAHDYRRAREYGLRPVLYARASARDYTIAVANSSLTLVEYNEAALTADLNDERAYHAAVYFNYLRGRSICPGADRNASGADIRIRNSAGYAHTAGDILLCRYAQYDAAGDVRACNWEFDLQYAVFMPYYVRRNAIFAINDVFRRVLREFGKRAALNEFNFFEPYNGVEDVIFRDNTVSFDLRPTYYNGVTESVFNQLHCNKPEAPHAADQVGQSTK